LRERRVALVYANAEQLLQEDNPVGLVKS